LPEILKEDFVIKTARFLQISPNYLLVSKKISRNKDISKKIDIAEASIIKTLYENPYLMNEIVEYLSVDMFKTHRYELQKVYEEDFNDTKLLDIVLREDIKILDYDKLKNQIRKILIPYYQEKDNTN